MNDSLYARINALLQEFHFLKNYVKNIRSFSEKPLIQRVDLELLDNIPHTSEWSDYRDNTRCWLVNSSGIELAEVRQCQYVHEMGLKWLHFIRKKEVKGESVLDAIKKLSDIDQVSYVVWLRDIWNRRPDHDPDWGVTMTIYKVPSGYKFSDWISKIPEMALTELRNDIKKIDAV